MFTRTLSGSASSEPYGQVYTSKYVLMNDSGGNTPSEDTQSFTATEDCIAELHLSLVKIGSIFAYANISLNGTVIRQFQNINSEIHNEVFHLKAGDVLSVTSRTYQTGYSANYLLVYTAP